MVHEPHCLVVIGLDGFVSDVCFVSDIAWRLFRNVSLIFSFRHPDILCSWLVMGLMCAVLRPSLLVSLLRNNYL